MVWGCQRVEWKTNILCLNTVQLSTYPPNKTIFLGTELVGAEFLGAELVRGRVGKGPSLLGAEFVRGRDVPESRIPTELWEHIAQDRIKWQGLIRRGAGEYEKQKESAKPSRNVCSGKTDLRPHQQSFLPQTSLVLSATGSLELRLVSSAILEHTNNNTLSIWLGLVIVSNDRRTYIIYKLFKWWLDWPWLTYFTTRLNLIT